MLYFVLYFLYCRVAEALIFGSWMLGQALAYAPNVNTAVMSAKNLFALLDREPLIKSSPDAKPLKGWVKIYLDIHSIGNYKIPTEIH